MHCLSEERAIIDKAIKENDSCILSPLGCCNKNSECRGWLRKSRIKVGEAGRLVCKPRVLQCFEERRLLAAPRSRGQQALGCNRVHTPMPEFGVLLVGRWQKVAR